MPFRDRPRAASGCARAPFLSLPPFPKRSVARFERAASDAPPLSDAEVDALIDQLAGSRVGGTWWGAQPELGAAPYLLVRGRTPANPPGPLRHLQWFEDRTPALASADDVVSGVCDPWHLLGRASALWCEPDDPLRLIAGLAGVPVQVSSLDAKPEIVGKDTLRTMLREALGPRLYLDPFSGAPMPWPELIALCGEWRRLIDSNRGLAAVYGFAGWKRATTEPLLWDGSTNQRFNREPSSLQPGDKVAVWKSRTPAAQLHALQQAGAVLIEVEDGFIRSAGLGANCVPPQSILVDELGAHFDARSPTTLERMLQEDGFEPELLARAQALRATIVSLGLSKYESGQERLERRSSATHVLVPGQVEDDRAVTSSIGPPLSNLQLLRQVRLARPDAHIIYKPHPDVEAGHRTGGMPDAAALQFADEVVRVPSISSWIDLVDEVHVNSSLAGFEALLRERRVTTHGVPFYAGWGLTEDLGPVPDRRQARRSLDELVAAVLILYPRYVDPVTNLPCSPEVLIARLSEQRPARARRSPLTLARGLQGRLRRTLAALAGKR